MAFRFLPVALLLLVAYVARQAFVAPSAGRARSRVQMRGFKDDFYAWKETLSSEDQALLLKQAQNEFDKKFRGTDEFKTYLSEDKIGSFGKVLQKFFDNERDDYKKEIEMKTPDYNHLQEKTRQAGYDWSLKRAIVEIDRDGERRWQFAADRAQLAREKGEILADSAPLEENYLIPNKGENHTLNTKLFDQLTKALKDGSAPKEAAKLEKALSAFKVPKDGEDFPVRLPRKLVELTESTATDFTAKLGDKEKMDDALEKEYWQKQGEVVSSYYEMRESIEKDVAGIKKFYGSQKKMPGKTKADILKQIWAELPKHLDTPVAPLDDEMLTQLAKEPAVIEGEFKHTWGTADKLYKGEAIDSFGNRYLLGVFETQDEAAKAFDAWNKEYEEAGAQVQENLRNWAKQQEADLAEEQAAVDEIMADLEKAQSR